ncbi:hypothetical protein IWX49DRAFT_566949 [Phyllosticta citricarpa]
MVELVLCFCCFLFCPLLLCCLHPSSRCVSLSGTGSGTGKRASGSATPFPFFLLIAHCSVPSSCPLCTKDWMRKQRRECVWTVLP